MRSQSPGGGLDIFTDRDQRSILPYIFGLLTKCCMLKCFILSTVVFKVHFYSSCTSVTTVQTSLLSYHASLLLNESCLMRVFLGFCFSESISGGFLSVPKYFLGHSETPSSTGPCL